MSSVAFPDDAFDRRYQRQLREIAASVNASVNAAHRRELKLLSEQMSRYFAEMNRAELRQVNKAVNDLLRSSYSPALQEAMAKAAELASNSLQPFYEQLARNQDALAAIRSIQPPSASLEQIAKAAGVSEDAAGQLYEALATDLDTAANEDPQVAPLWKVPLPELGPEQREAVRKFIVRWAGNSGFDLAVGNHVFGDTYVDDVLVWAATLAVFQVMIWMVVFKPDEK